MLAPMQTVVSITFNGKEVLHPEVKISLPMHSMPQALPALRLPAPIPQICKSLFTFCKLFQSIFSEADIPYQVLTQMPNGNTSFTYW